MAVNAQLSVNSPYYTAGQNPPPQCTLTIYNPNSTALFVVGVDVYATTGGTTQRNMAFLPVVPAIGIGSNVTVSPASYLTIGPFPIVVGSGANVNSYQALNQAGSVDPINRQPSQPANVQVNLGCTVYMSDGSVNEAGGATVFATYATQPPLGFQGGFANFAGPNNSVLIAVGVG